MYEGSITLQLAQDDRWAVKTVQGPWATDLEEWFLGSALNIKDKTFGNAGIQLQYNEGSPRGYIGDGANAFWKFDGAKLTWKATNSELDADGNFQCAGGNIAGWTITPTVLHCSDSIILNSNTRAIAINDQTFGHRGIQLQYQAGFPRIYIGDGANEYLKFDGSNLSWKGAYSALGTNGKLTCTGGTIGGWTIGATTLANGTNIILDASNKAISINDATFGHQGVQIQYNAGTPRFYVGDGAAKWVKFDGTDLQVCNGEIKAVQLTDVIVLGDGSTISGTITLNIAEGQGDCYIAAGKSDFTTADAGFILGQDDSDSNKAKFYLGDANDFLYWNGSALVLSGNVLAGAITLGDGSNVSGTITLSIADGQGDCYIAAGKSDFTNVDAGFILGQDDSDSNKAKLFIGNSTDYLNWDGTNLTINVSQNDAIVIQSGGDISLYSDASNPGMIQFIGSGSAELTTKFGNWAEDGSSIQLRPSDATDDANIAIVLGTYDRRFSAIELWSSEHVILESYIDGDNFIRCIIQSTVDYMQCLLILEYDTTQKYLTFYHDADELYFSPSSNKDWDLGQASTAWDDAYADDWNNVADFFHLDDRPDLAVIQNIKGSGVIDKRTGLELIDDKTLPQWLLAKDKNTGDVLYDADGKPYIPLKAAISLNWGAIRELKAEVDSLKAQLADVRNRI